MKAIETKYKGYNFRSRVEARWAIFFDQIGLPYRYEEEGYDLDGTWYLPDFWVPDWNAWVEIKGKKPDREAIRKAHLLREKSKKRVLIVYGSPWPGEYKAIPFNPPDWPEGALEEEGEFLQCRRCENLFLASLGDHRIPYAWISLGHPIEVKDCGGCSDRQPIDTPQLEKAYSTAREARFEDG